MSIARIIVPLTLCLASSVALASVAGCAVRTGPEPVYATTEVTAAPVEIESYPQAQYEGRTVYLYNDHWYYRNGSNWSYYRDEPAPLQEQRRLLHAPPAPRSNFNNAGPRQEAPPAPGRLEEGPAAPPAVRVQ